LSSDAGWPGPGTPARSSGRPPAGAGPPLRADARWNRARILAAAEAVFAAGGPAASTEDVAREAGVAIGTVFRHFPTKRALIEAVLVGWLRRLTDEAVALADAEEPGDAFFGFFAHWAELSATKHAFADALAGAGIDVGAIETTHGQAVRELLTAAETLLARAQRAGAVRADLRLPELRALLIGASRAAEYAGRDLAVRARVVALIGDGLRPTPRGRQVG
jgi:AcrR family transcriptional regulator